MMAEERAHAILSASGAHRWIECPPSARLEEQFPDEPSPYAEEGTVAHELAEIRLKQALGERVRLSPRVTKSQFYNEAMEDHIADYVALVMERITAHRANTTDPRIMFEQRLDYSRWVPDGFGTGDVVIVSDLGAEVIDLKYGQGVRINAEGNPQTRLYGLGAYEAFSALYDIERVYMTIVQPRLDHISTEELGIGALLEWAEEVIVPAAQLAYAGEGAFRPGEHCRFCRARYTCRARAEANLDLARYEFAAPATLSPDEIAEILTQLERDFLSWVSDIQTYALDQAVNHGVKFPGWKVVEGRSNRRYADEKAVKAVLRDAGYTDDQILRMDLRGITDIEKLLGKKRFAELLADYIIKPAGKPTLVPESDKRPEISSKASAAADFATATN